MNLCESEVKVCRNCARFYQTEIIVDEQGSRHPHGFVNPSSCPSAGFDCSGAGGTTQGNRMCTDEERFLPRE